MGGGLSTIRGAVRAHTGSLAPKPEGELVSRGSGAGLAKLIQPLVQASVAIGTSKLSLEGESGSPRLEGLFEKLPASRAAFELLKEKGLLAAKDVAGVSLEERLAQLVKLPAAHGVTGTELAGHVLEHLASPYLIHQGEGTTTCTVAVAQALLAERRPADYARMVVELASTGVSKTIGGQQVTADWRGREVREGRDPVEDLMQESLLTFGESTFPDGQGGSIGKGIFRSTRRLGSAALDALDLPGGNLLRSSEPRALTSKQFASVAQSLTGEARHEVRLEGLMAKGQVQTLESILDVSLKSGPVPAGVVGQDASVGMGHALSITALRGKGADALVTLHDPGDGSVKEVPLLELHKQIETVAVSYEAFNSNAAQLLRTSQTLGAIWGAALGLSNLLFGAGGLKKS